MSNFSPVDLPGLHCRWRRRRKWIRYGGPRLAAQCLQYHRCLSEREHASEAVEGLEKCGDTNKLRWIHCNLKVLKQTSTVTKQLKDKKLIDGISSYSISTYFQLTFYSSSLLQAKT